LGQFGVKGQTLGAFLEDKVDKESKLSQYVNNKKCSPTLIEYQMKQIPKTFLQRFS
jgi:hypothetical protein